MTVLNRLFLVLIKCLSNGLFCCLALRVFVRLFFSEYGFLIFSNHS